MFGILWAVTPVGCPKTHWLMGSSTHGAHPTACDYGAGNKQDDNVIYHVFGLRTGAAEYDSPFLTRFLLVVLLPHPFARREQKIQLAKIKMRFVKQDGCDRGNLNSCILFFSMKMKEVWSAPWRWCWGQDLQRGLQSCVSLTDTSGLAWGGGCSWELERDLTAPPLSHLPLFHHTLEMTCSTLSAGCSDNWSLCLKEVDKQLGGY